MQMLKDRTTPIDVSDVPIVDKAVSAIREQGGRLTDPTDSPSIHCVHIMQEHEQQWRVLCGISIEEVRVHNLLEMKYCIMLSLH